MGALGTGVAGTAWLDEAVVAQSLLRRPRIAVKADANDAGPIDKKERENFGGRAFGWVEGRHSHKCSGMRQRCRFFGVLKLFSAGVAGCLPIGLLGTAPAPPASGSGTAVVVRQACPRFGSWRGRRRLPRRSRRSEPVPKSGTGSGKEAASRFASKASGAPFHEWRFAGVGAN